MSSTREVSAVENEAEALLSKVAPNGKITTGADAYLFDMRGPALMRLLLTEIATLRQREIEVRAEPIPMVLHCPNCGEQHIDQEEDETTFRHRMEAFSLNAEWQDRVPSRWTNPPHKSHLCHKCGTVWRPADVPTNGVAGIQTRGKEDTWSIRHDSEAQEGKGESK